MLCVKSKNPLRTIALLMAALFVLCLAGCKKLDEGIEGLAGNDDPYKEFYDKGVEAYEDHDFYAAREYFLTADGYANSQEFLDAIDEYERIYLQGVELLEAKDHVGARSCFEAVRDFSNASEYIDYIDGLKALYDEGMRLYSEQDFVAAKDCFERADGYLRSADYIASIDEMEEKYQFAMMLYNEHKLEAAIKAFEAIGANYKDTYDIISAIYGELEHGGILITDYLEAYLRSHELDGEHVEFVLTDINETGFMITDSQGLLIIGSTNEKGMVTEVSFWVGEELAETLTKAQINAMLTHGIHALDIEMMTCSGILANFDEYANGKATYGNFSFELRYDDSGYAVLTGEFIAG